MYSSVNFARMLTEEEIRFIEYWEQNREKQARWQYQLLSGLPRSFLIFGIPMLLNFIAGKFWYKRLPYVSPGDVNFILLAALLIVVFFSMFRKKFQWEQREEQYIKLKSKQQKTGQ